MIQNRDRANQIVLMRRSGKGLLEIAKNFNLCRERIGQILSALPSGLTSWPCRYCGKIFSFAHRPSVYCSRLCEKAMKKGEKRLDAFLSKIDFVPDANGCFNWKACTIPTGYGKIYYKGKYCYAHQAAYDAFVAPVTNSLHVLHYCDNPSCCNPAHLWLGTHFDNMRDRDKKGRTYFRAENLEGENNYTSKLTCDKVRQIRVLRDMGKKNCELAKLFNVTASCISSVVLRKSWKHVA